MDNIRTVDVLVGHDHPEEEVCAAAEQEAVRPEVIVDQLRPVSVLLGKTTSRRRARGMWSRRHCRLRLKETTS